MTIEDLVMKAGGLKEGASTARVDVSRRIKDPKGTTESNTIGMLFSFELNDGYLIGGGQDFYLEPYDQVYIRKSPTYHHQQNVAVGGEVLFPGAFALAVKNERLSDLITKAGGVTKEAYVKGARLIRQMSPEERQRKRDVLRLAATSAEASKDSISIGTLDLGNYYSVGIDLEKALASPNSDYDLVLREGDMLYVPEYVNTVKINGAVMYPNTVIYNPGESLKYYINQAGGYGYNAKKKKTYVVYLNGTVSRLKRGSSKLITPGCEIIIPSKQEKKPINTAEIIGMSSTTASLAAVVASMVKLFQ